MASTPTPPTPASISGTVFNDANGEYLGFDQKVHQATDFQYFTDLSLWDTFRTVHPLYTLIAPKDQRDMVVSLIPNFNRALCESLASTLPGVPYVTLLTDLADHPPNFWIEKDQAQHFICGSTRAVQQARAAELFFLAQPFDAKRAVELGLVTRVVADDDVLQVATDAARTLAAKPSGATRAMKRTQMGRAARAPESRVRELSS